MSHSDNKQPANHALEDQTLRRSGEQDMSDLTTHPYGHGPGGEEQYPQNPRIDIYEPQVGGRTALTNDVMLQLGTPPERIDRVNNSRMLGYAEPTGHGRDKSGEVMTVSHVPSFHDPNNPPTLIPSHAVDDNMSLPTPRIGNPLV